MKLGEARIRLEQLENWLQINECAIGTCPRQYVVKMLEESNGMLSKQRDLSRRIRDTEESVLLEGTSLAEVEAARQTLDRKITMMENLAARTDLEPQQRAGLFEQLKNFRASRDALMLSIERCSWETELLGE